MRTKSRRPLITAAAVLIATLGGIAGPVSAASMPNTDNRDFPEFAPDWYTTAAGPSYESGNPPAPMMLSGTAGLYITYYAPSGGFPGDESPDIDVRQAATVATSSMQFDLARSPELAAALGSAFMDGIAVPVDADAATQPVVGFNGGIITVTRPPMPKDCDSEDSANYDVRVVLLTENQQKYLVDLHAAFRDRPPNEIADQQVRCAPVVSEIPVEQAPAPYDDAQMTPAEPVADQSTGYDLWYLALLVVVVAGIVVLARRFQVVKKLKKASSFVPRQPAESEFDDHGNKVGDGSSTATDAPNQDDEYTAPGTKPKPEGIKGRLKSATGSIRGLSHKMFGEAKPDDDVY